jgi:hypothetical protein
MLQGLNEINIFNKNERAVDSRRAVINVGLFFFSLSRSFGNQYNETNVMHFSFNLLKIKGLYMFRALLAHP